jgi:hypothetical protein
MHAADVRSGDSVEVHNGQESLPAPENPSGLASLASAPHSPVTLAEQNAPSQPATRQTVRGAAKSENDKTRNRAVGFAMGAVISGTIAFVYYNPVDRHPAHTHIALRETRRAGTPTQTTFAETDVNRALQRLARAFEPLPPRSAPAVLRGANQWLTRAGAPACFMESAAGEAALLVGPGKVVPGKAGLGRSGVGPLTAALSRCADAVEQTLRERNSNDLPP